MDDETKKLEDALNAAIAEFVHAFNKFYETPDAEFDAKHEAFKALTVVEDKVREAAGVLDSALKI